MSGQRHNQTIRAVRYPLGQMSARRIAHFALTLLFIVGLVQAQSSVTISAITPAQIAAGSGATDITITGTGFSAGSVVRVGGETVPVSFITTVPQRSLASGTVGGANAVLFPQFALSGGWATQISLVNNNLTTVSGRVDVFDSAGSPMAVTLNGQSGSMFSYSLTPGASLVLAPRDTNGQTPF
jgi:hypothetical protein